MVTFFTNDHFLEGNGIKTKQTDIADGGGGALSLVLALGEQRQEGK